MNMNRFEELYGRIAPPSLIGLRTDVQPVRFEFDGKFPFVIEIQYFISVDGQSEEDIRRNLFAFAVNTDGHKMLFDVEDENCSILQDEFGDIDSIGVTINDLLTARACPL
jgi:hypothetical protein